MLLHKHFFLMIALLQSIIRCQLQKLSDRCDVTIQHCASSLCLSAAYVYLQLLCSDSLL